MFLEKIKILNFKCFEHKYHKEKMSGGINIFLGQNGSGKTSFFEAINFLFSEKNPNDYFEKKKMKNFLPIPEKNNFSVIEAFFDNSDFFFPFPTDKIRIKKITKMSCHRFMVNGNFLSAKKLRNFFHSSKIGIENIFFYTKQGSHSIFKFQNPSRRLKILKNRIGLDFFEISKKKSIILLEKSEYLKRRISIFVLGLLQKAKKKVLDIENEKKEKKEKKSFNFIKKICANDKLIFTKKKTDFLILSGKKMHKNLKFVVSRIYFLWIYCLLIKIKKRFFFPREKEINEEKGNFFKINKLIQRLETNNAVLKVRKMEEIWKKMNHKKKIKHGIKKFYYKKVNSKPAKKKTFFIPKKKSRFLSISEKNKITFFKLLEKKTFVFWEKDFIYKNLRKFERIQFDSFFGASDKQKIKRKFFFFLTEIFIEKEIIKKNILKKEKNLEIILGKKSTRGIRHLLFLIKSFPILKKKVFGLLFDLFSAHKYFKLCVENFLGKFLNFIVIDEPKTALEIIRKSTAQKDLKLNFLINSKISKKKSNFIKKTIGIPLHFCIHHKKKFSDLFDEIFLNSFVTKKNNIFEKFDRETPQKIVTLDGEIYEKNHIRTFSETLKKNSLIFSGNYLKKERIFFEWAKFSEKRMEILTKNLDMFLLRKFNLIESNRCSRNHFKNFLFKKNYIPQKDNLTLVDFFSKKKRERKIVQKERKENLSKIFNTGKNTKKPNSEGRGEKEFFYLNFEKILFIFQSFSIFKKVFFFSRVFCKFFLEKNFTMKKIFKKKTKNLKIFGGESKNLLVFHNVFLKNIIFFLKIFSSGFLMNIIKINFIFKRIELLYVESKKKCEKYFEIKLHFIKVPNSRFSGFSLLFFLMKKINSSNNFLNKKNVLRKKILKLLSDFREIETDLIVIKQTFGNIQKKKNQFLNNCIIKISTKFNQLCGHIFRGGNGSIIIHYEDFPEIFSKKTLLKRISGLSILFKLKKEGLVKFIDQSSVGQASLIYLLMLISFREIVKVKIYIFDEFETNLDPDHLKIFCYLIKQFSTFQIQFLISTFRKTLFLTGDKWFGFYKKKKNHLLICIDKKESLKFN